jgi:WD40 repeat protein
VKFLDSLELLDRKQNPPPWQPPQQKKPPEKQQPPATEKPSLPLVATLRDFGSRGPPSVTFFSTGDRLLVNRNVYAANGWFKQGALGGNAIPSVVALAPNGQTAAVAGAPGELELVNVASGRTTKLVQHDGGERPEAIAALAFSPDGKTLAGHTASALILWDVATGAKRATRPNDPARANAGGPVVAFSPDNAHLAASPGDEVLVLRDPKSGDVQKDLWVDRRAGITGLAFSPDGKKLAWMDSSGAANLWDLVVLRTFPLLDPGAARAGRPHAVAFAPNGGTVALTGQDDRVIFVDVKERKQRLILRTGHVRTVRNMAFSPDRRFLATSGEERAVKVWDVSSLTGGVVAQPPKPPDPPVPGARPHATLSLPSPAQDVCVGRGGRFLIFHLPLARRVAVFDANEAKIVKLLPVAEQDILLAAGDDKLIMVSPGRNLFRRWNLKTLKREQLFFTQTRGSIRAMAMGSASAGPLVLVRDGGMELLDPQTFKPSDVQLPGGGLGMGVGVDRNSLRVSANGQVIVAGQNLLVRQGKEYKGFPAPAKAVPGPDGQSLSTPGRLYTAKGEPLGEQVGGHGKMVWYLPALHGSWYFSLNQVKGAGFAQSTLSLSVYLPPVGRPLDTLPELDGLSGLVDWGSGQTQPFDRHVFPIPDANLVVILPVTKDRLILHRVDFNALLEKSKRKG